MGYANIFLGGSDPVLGSSLDLDAKFRDLELAEKALARQKQQLIKMQEQAVEPSAQPKSSTPVWDEIDSVTAQMSEKEFEKLVENEEFKQSSNALAQLIQATQLAQLRPIIENSQNGKDILDRHLTLIKRLRKSASAEVDEELNDFQVYKEHYSDMPYSEYLKTKKTRKENQ